MKTYSFILFNSSRQYIGEYDTRCYTLAEAEAEFRHYIRKQIPHLFDSPVGFGYTCKVTP